MFRRTQDLSTTASGARRADRVLWARDGVVRGRLDGRRGGGTGARAGLRRGGGRLAPRPSCCSRKIQGRAWVGRVRSRE